jgi:hypothetical protein
VVLAEADVGMVCRGRPFTGWIVHDLLEVASVGKIEVQAEQRRQRLVRLRDVLVHERHNQHHPVGQVRVEVPPLVGTRRVVGACAVLPRRDRGGRESEPLIVRG